MPEVQNKNSRNLEVIFFLIIIVISSFVYAVGENIIIDYPLVVNYSQPFIINLTLINLTSTYDVKIDIINSSYDRISQIYDNGTWKSTNYYINSAIDTSITNSSEFMLNITDVYNGTASMNITLRKSSTSTLYKFGPYNITIIYTEPEEPQQNTTQNQTNPTLEPDIILELEHESEIENGDEFNVKIRAYNLKNYSYDIKVYVTPEGNDTIISEIYNKEESDWNSGEYYLNVFIEGPGNETKTVKLRIDNEYRNFKGDATIYGKIRKYDTSTIIKNFDDDIKVTKKQTVTETTSYIAPKETQKNFTQEQEIIKLNSPKDIKTQKVTIYKSKSEYIKEYSIYGFAIFCILIIVYMVRKK